MDSMELELWEVVNYPWMLGIELGLLLSQFSSPASLISSLYLSPTSPSVPYLKNGVGEDF